jgi:hypothetical protein
MEPIPGLGDESGSWGPVAIGVGVFLAIVGIAAATAYIITTGDAATPIEAVSGIAAETGGGGFELIPKALQTFTTSTSITPASIGTAATKFVTAATQVLADSPNEIPMPQPVMGIADSGAGVAPPATVYNVRRPPIGIRELIALGIVPRR